MRAIYTASLGMLISLIIGFILGGYFSQITPKDCELLNQEPTKVWQPLGRFEE